MQTGIPAPAPYIRSDACIVMCVLAPTSSDESIHSHEQQQTSRHPCMASVRPMTPHHFLVCGRATIFGRVGCARAHGRERLGELVCTLAPPRQRLRVPWYPRQFTTAIGNCNVCTASYVSVLLWQGIAAATLSAAAKRSSAPTRDVRAQPSPVSASDTRLATTARRHSTRPQQPARVQRAGPVQRFCNSLLL
jgi:hypothetical protein